MASLSHLLLLQSFSSNKLLSAPLPFFHHKLLCSSNQNHPRICAPLTKQSRASRKVKSNDELRNDIKEFLSTVGLPLDHVPSTKELSQHGRQDLANIVRRRGYKFIRELLANQIKQQCEEVKDTADDISLLSQSTEGERVAEDLVDSVLLFGEAANDEENMNDLADDDKTLESTEVARQTEDLAEDVSLSAEATKDEENTNDYTDDISLPSEATEVERKTEDLAEDVSLSNKATKDGELMINFSKDATLSYEATISEENVPSAEVIRELKPSDHTYTDPYSRSSPSLEEKVAKFIKDGELDDIEESGFETLKRSTSADFTKSQDSIESKSHSAHAAQEDLAFSGGSGSDLSNGHVNFSCQPVEHLARENNASRAEILSNDKVMVVDQNKDLDVEPAQRAHNQGEISRLRHILHQKELELTKLKEQIEKEKEALSFLQTKAEKEISQAQKLIFEKDSELHAAEESLSELKEVEIEYQGVAEIIEVAGSFNGWHQRIKMDPVASSSISDLSGSRKYRVWRTLLWLYPGVYEIKFIADGRWTLDPERESVTKGSIQNNILRVDR